MSHSTPSPLSLKVAEALSRDVGKGFARLDPADIQGAGLAVGDIVRLRGKRATAAKVMPAHADARGHHSIQIDGLTRRNAGIGLGERISIEPIAARSANRVTLVPLDGRMRSVHNMDRTYMGKLLSDVPVQAGDVVRATLFGSQFQDFTVHDSHPNGIVLIRPETRIHLEGRSDAPRGPAPITYEDIGGLGKAVQRVREMVELPLKYPQVFERLGIEPPKGVLLYGPPGCGKTLLARAVAHETDATFLTVNGPEIIHKFYGESEARLREIFEQAKKRAPSIVFLDELDAIAPKREQVVGEVEKRVVAQLLALMDGLESRGDIIVIGATNLPNHLDPALRRPGRFDREIAIGIPDTPARQHILDIHTRGMPLTEAVDLQKLANVTHGFTGADLEALAREAAMAAIRTIVPQIDFSWETLPDELLHDLSVDMEHFLTALREIEPSAIREVFVEVPDVAWHDIGGLDDVKRRLREAVEWPLWHRALLEYAKLRSPKGILLYGPPGCGKTLLAKALARESGVNLIAVKGPELMSKYVGESERGVRDIFQKARQASPCVIFFDEIDALAPQRSLGGGDSHVSDRVVSQLLTEMDGLQELKGLWVLAATNRRDIIDPALLRPGRFDLQFALPPPDDAARLAILQIHMRYRPLAADVALPALAQASAGFSGADLEAWCWQATALAVREFLDKLPAAPLNTFCIAAQHFEVTAPRGREGENGNGQGFTDAP